jgi:hypothetical protein
VPLRHAWVLPLTPTAAARLSGQPAGKPWMIAAATGLLIAATPFAVSGLQLHLCEGALSRPLHAAIGFSYTFVFTAVTLLLAVVSARLVD